MRTKWVHTLFLGMGIVLLTSAELQAQTGTGGRGPAQTDVAVSVFGAFTGGYNNTVMSPEAQIFTAQSYSNAAGGLLEVRHISKPWFGYEGTYSFNRANQDYYSAYITHAVLVPSCGQGYICNSTPAVSANAHEIAGDWVASLKWGNLRPFALAGGGILVEVPASGQLTATIVNNGGEVPPGTTTTTTVNTTPSTKPVFVYGAGLDWGLLPHIGLRVQYRGNLYKAPALISGLASTNTLTHTAEPMIGVYFRF